MRWGRTYADYMRGANQQYRWFAWRPVQLETWQWVWLEYVWCIDPVSEWGTVRYYDVPQLTVPFRGEEK